MTPEHLQHVVVLGAEREDEIVLLVFEPPRHGEVELVRDQPLSRLRLVDDRYGPS